MVRKLLIALALIIAIAPFAGISHSFAQGIMVTLALIIASILLFSRRPRTILPPPAQQDTPLEPIVPVPSQAMQSLSVNHQEQKDEHAVVLRPPVVEQAVHFEGKVIVAPIAGPQEAPSVIEIPRQKKRVARPSPLAALREEATIAAQKEGTATENPAALTARETSELHAFEVSRRARRAAPKSIISEEEQVQPADKPFPVHRHASSGHRIDYQ